VSPTTLTPRPRGEQPLDAALQPIHRAWVQQARRFLEPALAPHADFWTRWAAVRYLTDDFREQYRLERALLDELRPFLDAETASELVQGGDRVFRLRLELDRVGRRRGTADEMVVGTRRLLEQLVAWLAEIELAADGLTRDSLPSEAAELLAHLEAGRPAHP
jgi:hypothetical protein